MKTSAGILVYRFKNGQPEVFIVHNGGPFWAKKDNGVWSLPKGEVEEGDEPLATARREFAEETSLPVPEGDYQELGEVIYPRRDKKIIAWTVEGDFDASQLSSNTFEIEWPPRSGKKQTFPEIDRGGWFSLPEASVKLFAPNLPFLERLANLLKVPFGAEKTPEPPKQNSLF
jgi:predicted NUDIX family NTP pyrophosphohydrolase